MKGEILGLIYDGEAWKWEIPTDKLDRMLVLLGSGIRQRYLTNGEAMTLSGKLNHYSPVVQGKFERCLITQLVGLESEGAEADYLCNGLVVTELACQ